MTITIASVNKNIVFLFGFIIVLFIGYLDYVTLPELSFSLFYLIPIALLSIYRKSSLKEILFCTCLSTVLWFVADFFTRDYASIFFPIWNAFVRLLIFNSFGLLIFYLRRKQIRLDTINKILIEVNDEKNRIIGITAHDVRNPLSSIFAFSDMLISEQKETLHPEVLAGLGLMRSASGDTLKILENLLDLSKIESGIIELKMQRLDYYSFVSSQITLYKILSGSKNIAIKLTAPSEKILVDFDEHYLSEVIGNLLSNAIKYSPVETEINVIISINKDKVLTEVVDQGKGIPHKEQVKLFNYFQTASSRPTGGEKSTGLGLAISKKIVLLHNGEIGLRSEVNNGAVFYYIIPKANDSN